MMGGDLLRLQRGATHIQRLGPRATAELLIAIASRTGAVSIVLDALAEFEAITPDQIHAAGAVSYPPHLRMVPSRSRNGEDDASYVLLFAEAGERADKSGGAR